MTRTDPLVTGIDFVCVPGSAAELGSLLDLGGHAVERLRDRVIFLPR